MKKKEVLTTNFETFEEFLKLPKNKPNPESKVPVEDAFIFLNDVELYHALTVDKAITNHKSEEELIRLQMRANQINKCRHALLAGNVAVRTILSPLNHHVTGRDDQTKRWHKSLLFAANIHQIEDVLIEQSDNT
jgi:hypothetical protein